MKLKIDTFIPHHLRHRVPKGNRGATEGHSPNCRSAPRDTDGSITVEREIKQIS